MTDDDLLELLDDVVAAVRQALDLVDDWGPAGTRAGQYRSDLAADAAALGVLVRAPVGILSEETGVHHPERPLMVVLDPVDGSTNASHQLPWFNTSLCVLDADGPRVALIVNQATGERFAAVRGRGATRNGAPIRPRRTVSARDALVGINGLPPHSLGWAQFRAYGAAALDLCSVACGRLDAYVDCDIDAHGPWDYLGGLLVCAEAGAVVVDAFGRELVLRDHHVRRTPVGAATAELAGELSAARRSYGQPG